MKQLKTLQALAVAAALVTGGMATLPAQAQQSDLVLFGPASNPGGLVGFIQAYETNASEFYPAFLPAAANVPNNIGVIFYEDPSQTILSDQIWTQAGFWYFASDPDLINFATFGITPVGALVEDGTQQDVSSFFLLPPGSMSVFSDVSEVPEPPAFALAGLGAAALLIFRRRR
jgi:MYXO-CTERM domain-containing protein